MAPRDAYRRRDRAWQPTDRQRAVLDLLAEGRSNAEIAVRLGVTLDGAKWHVGELLSQTGCEDRQALASWWRRERDHAGKTGLIAGLSWRHAASGAIAVAAGVVLLAVVVALTSGGGSPAEPEATLGATPTPWPDEALEALAASQGPPPATCEPPEAQDLRIVDASILLAEGLEPAGRILVAGHCPLYVANRADRSLVWMAGGGLLRLTQADGWRLVQWSPCCYYAAYLDEYYLTAGNTPSPDGRPHSPDAFDLIDSSTTGVRPVFNGGTYLMVRIRERAPTPGGLHHRVAFASDGQMFVDPEPLSGDIVVNGLTGETIDVSDLGPGMALGVEVATGAVRTDCWDWEEHGVCRVYLDGVRGAREGDTGIFNPPVMPAPFDGVLSCVADDEGGWSIDGPALAYELSNGNLTLRVGALGGAGEEWEDCQPRDVRRGQAFPVWTYTYIEAFVGGEAVSIVSTRDGRFFVGEVALDLGCPCEGRR